jgi:hypothetical protein
MSSSRCSLMLAAAVGLAVAGLGPGPKAQSPNTEPSLTEAQQREFLLNAKIINYKQIGKGVTSPWRLTLSDGAVTHDAAFQNVDLRQAEVAFRQGPSEIGFRDFYGYNIAAYELAKLVGLSDMVPVTVERKWKGQAGALSWWVPWKWDEEMRQKQNLQPPNAEAWNNQVDKVRVFVQLIYDTDRNAGNLLIAEDWKLWIIDFTRAFRLHKTLRNPEQLQRCDRQLWENLHKLNGKELMEKTASHLSKGEVQALMARRDAMVDCFRRLIQQKGESAVLY